MFNLADCADTWDGWPRRFTTRVQW
jgi:hypothetical protein